MELLQAYQTKNDTMNSWQGIETLKNWFTQNNKYRDLPQTLWCVYLRFFMYSSKDSPSWMVFRGSSLTCGLTSRV
jgi:hypothetical protein